MVSLFKDANRVRPPKKPAPQGREERALELPDFEHLWRRLYNWTYDWVKNRFGRRAAVAFAVLIVALVSLHYVFETFETLPENLHRFSEGRERERQIRELEKTAAMQLAEHDYSGAWTNLEQAAKLAETGNSLSALLGRQKPESRGVNTLRENLAMAWMEDIHVTDDQKFSSIVDQIQPVLQRGAASATGTRKGNLLAHVGWGIFLRHRDGAVEANPEPVYKEALRADPNNPYALANWGHWLLWERSDKLQSAIPLFTAALASGREREYVRRIQLSALENRFFNDDKCAAELLRQVNDMRKNGEPIDAAARDAVYGMYYLAFGSHNDELLATLLATVPPTEQLVTFQSLFFNPDFDQSKVPSRQAYLAFLQQAAGQTDESERTLATLRSRLSPQDYSYMITRSLTTVKQLSNQQH